MIFRFKKHLDFAEDKGMLDINIEVEEGHFIVINGPSGSGKTSFLRLIAGLESALEGLIKIGDEVWLDTNLGINIPIQKRRVGYVFQDYTLFPNMTVRQNLVYALEKNQNQSIIEELIEITELQSLTQKYPNTLSGGQQQRVALARALVRKPRILLLDEPLSALDWDMRNRLQNYILKIHKNYRITTLLVSHDRNETLKMADEVWLFKQGKVIEKGSPNTIVLNQKIKDEFKLLGKIFKIIEEEATASVFIRIGEENVKVTMPKQQMTELNIGHEVAIYFKAFEVILRKV